MAVGMTSIRLWSASATTFDLHKDAAASLSGSGIHVALEFDMHWVQSKIAGTSLDASLLKLQPPVTASFVSGSLTAGLLNLAAVAILSAIRQGRPVFLSRGSGRTCNG